MSVLTVNGAFAPTIAMAFGAASIPVNGTTTLTYTIANPNAAASLSGIGFTNTLPANLAFANGITNSCGGTATTTAGQFGTLTLTGGSLAAGGSCAISVNVTGISAGTDTNTTSFITSNESGTGGTATATIVITATTSATLTSSVNPSTFGQAVTFTATVTGTGFAAPTGTVTFKDGATAIGSGPITINGSGSASVTTSALTAGPHTITAAYSGDQFNSPTTMTLSQTVTANPPTIAMAFAPTSIPVNGTTTLTYMITNPNSAASLSGIGFSNNLPTGLAFATPNGLTNSCGGTITPTSGTGGTLTLSGASLAPSASCTISINVTGLVASSYTNTTQNITSTEGGTGGSASASMQVTATTSATLTSTLNPSNIGQAVTFTASVTGNFGGIAPTGTVSFTDGATTIGSGAIPIDGSGNASVTTSGLTAGPHTIKASYSGDQFYSPTSMTLSQTVNANAPTIMSSFGAATIPLNGVTSLSFTITNPNPATSLSGIAFTDNFPTPMVISSGPTGSCGGGTITAAHGANNMSLGGATLAAGASCTFSVNVTVSAGGNYTNTTTAISASNSASGGTTTASLTVAATGFTTVALASSANPAAVGQSVTFTATITPNGGVGSPTGTVTFKDGTSTLGTGTVNNTSGVATFATSSLAAGPHSITAVYGGDTNFTASTSSVLSQSVRGTDTTLVSSQDPSTFGQSVTFTATVTLTGGTGTPTGTVSFKDGASVVGTGTMNSSGVATYTTSSLSRGNHSMTAVFAGSSGLGGSTSAALSQIVNIPPDSAKLRALQLQVAKMEAQGAGQAISSAIDGAISDAFSDSNTPISGNDNGVRFNFAADPAPEKSDKKKNFDDRAKAAFAALGYDDPDDPNAKAPPPPPPAPAPAAAPKQWYGWAEVQGVGWNTGLQTGDIRGSQINALLGLGYKLTPDVLFGLFGGYENFGYTSQLLQGRLKGDGWTAGAYAAWRFLPGLRFDAGFARSGISYEGTAGTASGSFPGERWLATAALAGTYRTSPGFVIEPSLRVYALWEREKAYVDSLGTSQPAYDFFTGRASGGTKIGLPWQWSDTVLITPNVGVYADYYFNKDNATLPLATLPIDVVHGFSARVTSGVALSFTGGAQLSVGGELGGLGNDFKVWTVRGRGTVPF